ncbi:MAG: aromatic amino acid hydroxylase [Myxococcota bacterium]
MTTSPLTRTRDRVPPQLRRFVVEQDYSAYDEIDQAVWRFILLQTYSRLSSTAHPAYLQGLRQTGISRERIPRIAEMDACLGAYGWGAVAVDGFIPPRAFQEFQALGIMTIAAKIRSSDHLAYTPAPDIVHESAGHAPIVPDPKYREFLQCIGEIGSKAFSTPEDRSLYAAIHQLSEAKENPAATTQEIDRSTHTLARAEAAVTPLSEAGMLSRLHWWTVEYGLVGTPDDYRIFGAGLLSSLGESHFCHDPSVEKRRLDRTCIHTGYDITRPQPQLFVAEDFDHLKALLTEVADGLAQSVGGELAVARALASEELATLELSTGLQISGVLSGVRGGPARREYLQFSGPCTLGRDGQVLPGHQRDAHPEGYGTPLGRLDDGTALSCLEERELSRFAAGTNARDLRLRYASGVEVSGRLVQTTLDSEGRLAVLTFENCRVVCGGDLLFDPAWGRYDMAVAEDVASARAGGNDAGDWVQDASELRSARCPQPPVRTEDDVLILALYREALELWESPESPGLVDRFELIDATLRERFPHKWLLRWNLLECLYKIGRGGVLAATLRDELLAIEAERPDDLPISMGLRYLDERMA